MNTAKISKTLWTGVASALLAAAIAEPIYASDVQAPGTLPVIAPEERGSPKELLALLGKFIAAHDVDSIMAIHEQEAALVEWGGKVARGYDEVRQVYVDFFETDPDLKVQALQIVDAGGVAIILGDYTLDYTNANGKIVSVDGKFGDIVRQQPDGSWLYLLDNPYAP
jgi:ketosteroid isomerase-like protein